MSVFRPHDPIYRRAFSMITVLALLSVFISSVIISAANDIYAFIKPDAVCELNIDKPLTVYELALIMQKNGIISNPTLFSLYATIKEKDKDILLFSGDLILTSDMGYREILAQLSKK